MSTTCTKEQCDPNKEIRQIFKSPLKSPATKAYYCKDCFQELNQHRMANHRDYMQAGLGSFENYPLIKFVDFCPKSPDGEHKDNGTMFVNTCKYCGESEFFM